MTRVEVSSSVLRWALKRSGRPSEIKQKFPKLAEWIEGKSQPTLRQLENFAKATSTPLGYFFLSEPPDERITIPYFRTVGDQFVTQPSPELLETIQMMEWRQVWMREYLIEQGQEPLPFVRSAKLSDDPRHIAREMRDTLGLTEGWANEQPTWTDALRMLRRRMEEAGIIVVVNGIVGNNTHRKLDVDEFRGFVLVDEYAPLVFVNGADTKAAQMFTLAHELAHIWFGSSAVFDLRELHPANDEIERACNKVAAEFLVPEIDLREFWPRVKHESSRFQQIARRFKVSELVAARRALDLSLITKKEFLNFYREYQKIERNSMTQDRGGGDFYANQDLRIGRRFAKAVVLAAREGKLLYHEAYRLTGLYGEVFEKYAKHLESGELQ